VRNTKTGNNVNNIEYVRTPHNPSDIESTWNKDKYESTESTENTDNTEHIDNTEKTNNAGDTAMEDGNKNEVHPTDQMNTRPVAGSGSIASSVSYEPVETTIPETTHTPTLLTRMMDRIPAWSSILNHLDHTFPWGFVAIGLLLLVLSYIIKILCKISATLDSIAHHTTTAHINMQ